MRYLHPIAPHEKFVASGTYRYFVDDQPTGLVEHWTIHELPDGAWFMRVDRDGREFDGRTELIEAWRSPASEGGRIERYDLSAYGAPSDTLKKVRASYALEENILYVGRTFNDGERLQDELSLPDNCLLQPGSYLFFGMAIPTVVERAPYHLAARYSFTDPVGHAFSVAVTQPTISFYGDETIHISGRDIPAHRYFSGESRTPPDSNDSRVNWHTYWIDDHHIFLRQDSPNLRVQLERYAHRP